MSSKRKQKIYTLKKCKTKYKSEIADTDLIIYFTSNSQMYNFLRFNSNNKVLEETIYYNLYTIVSMCVKEFVCTLLMRE